MRYKQIQQTLMVLSVLFVSCGFAAASTHRLSVSPTTVNFGTQTAGTTSQAVVVVTNSGTGSVQITSVTVNGSSNFTVSGWTGQVALQPAQSLTLKTSFSPTAATSYSGTLSIGATAGASTSASLVGLGQGTPTPTPSIPNAPTNLQASAGSAQVSLSWTASSGASSYTVKRSTTSGGPYSNIATGVGATSFTDTSVTGGSTYYYVASALNSTGESSNSNQVSATPTAVASTPNPPTNLQASGGNAQVSLSWTASSAATSYTIKRSNTSGGPYSNIAAGLGGTGYTDSTVTNGSTYYYVASAVNSTGESSNSNQASATPSAVTTIVDVTKYGATGNGSTDDTAAINSAISALQSGSELLFPCGTYLSSSALKVITTSNVTIAGTPGCVTLKGTGSRSFLMQVGTGALSQSTPLTAVSAELATTFSANFSGFGGLSAGDYVYLSEGGKGYSSDAAPGNDKNCDVSGCRGEILQIQSVSGSTATVTTALHNRYDPSLNSAIVSKLTNPVVHVIVKDITFEGSGTVGTGLYIGGVADSSVSNVKANNFVNAGLLSYSAYNLAWNNISVTHAGNGGADAFHLYQQGKPSVNGATVSNLNVDAFGFGVSGATDGTFSNISVDKAGGTTGRPFKFNAASYNTVNNLTVKNGPASYNGAVLNYYSSHNTFNNCVSMNNSGHGIVGFGNFNQYNKFINCTSSGNTIWQIGQTQSSLGTYDDSYWEISGGNFTGTTTASGYNVLQLNGAHSYVHGATINGPGSVGVVIGTGATYSCVNSNNFSGTLSYSIYLNNSTGTYANNDTTVGAVYPNPLPTGTCQ